MQSLHVETSVNSPAADDEMAGPIGGPSGSPVPLFPVHSQTTLALIDLVDGARASHLWGLLGWQDIRRRYRRSVLGPFWLTLSMGVLVATLGTLYGALLKVDTAVYVPFLAIGFVLWTLISGLITDGCSAFISAQRIITQTSLPLSVHVYRKVWHNLLIFLHNVTVFVVAAIIFSVWPAWTALLALPGLVLLCLNGIWVGLVLGTVAARFRDVPPIVASVVRIAFFVTPIIWMPELTSGRGRALGLVLDFNPFYHCVELVRAPLLGQVPELVSWFAVSGITLCGWLLALAMLSRYRRRIAYWV